MSTVQFMDPLVQPIESSLMYTLGSKVAGDGLTPRRIIKNNTISMHSPNQTQDNVTVNADIQ